MQNLSNKMETTALFQIEGGADQRFSFICDTFWATEGKIAYGSNENVACDHYYRSPRLYPKLTTVDNPVQQMEKMVAKLVLKAVYQQN